MKADSGSSTPSIPEFSGSSLNRAHTPSAAAPDTIPNHPQESTIPVPPPSGTKIAQDNNPRTIEDNLLTMDMAAATPRPATPAPRSVRISGEIPDLRQVDPSDYLIGKELGRGGLGRVTSATDRRLQRKVALKVLLDTADDEQKTRFLAEAIVTARLQHPAIVPIYEVGQWPNGEQFYTMRQVPGRSLDEEIGQRKRLSDRLALLPHVIAVADAIAYAHGQRVIHRDIKPANILVGDYGETVVIDWGTAKYLLGTTAPNSRSEQKIDLNTYRTHTVDGSVMGTPAYMSPEHASNQPVDERTDVYSLGVVLFHLLLGRAPFQELTLKETLIQVRQGIIPLELIESRVSSDLLAILKKATQLLPKDRYRSAKDFAADLKRFQNGQLVVAYRYTPFDFIRHWLRTQRWAFFSTILALLLIILMGISTLLRYRNERDLSNRNQLKLILVQTLSTLERDPTRALVWLKEWITAAREVSSLQDKGGSGRSMWEEASDAALEAASRPHARHVFRPGQRRRMYGAFSPDSQLLAWAGPNETIELRDTRTGQVAYSWPGNALQVAFSPDGLTLAAHEGGSTVMLRNYLTGSTREFRAPDGDVVYMSYSPDGTRLLVSYHNHTVRLWDVASGTSRDYHGADNTSGAARFSPDGRRFAYPGGSKQDFAIFVYSVDENNSKMSFPILRGHHDSITVLSFSPDGRSLVSGSQDQTSRHWDLSTGKGMIITSEQGTVFNVTYSPANDQVAMTGDRYVRVWNRNTGQLHDLGAYELPLYDMSFSPDGQLLAWGTATRAVVYDLVHDNAWSLQGHETTVDQILFAPDGRQLLTGDYNCTARLWDVPETRYPVLHDVIENNARPVMAPNGRYLAALGANQIIRLWDMRTGTSRPLSAAGQQVWRFAFSPDSHRLATGNFDGTVRLWDVDRDTVTLKQESPGPIRALAFSPDGAWIAAVGSDNQVRLASATADTLRILPGRCDSLSVVVQATPFVFSPDGRWLAAPCTEDSAQLWEVATGNGRPLHGHHKRLTALSFSHDSRSMATASADGEIRLWDVKTTESEPVRQNPVRSRFVLFSPDDRTLAFTTGNAVVLWDRTTRASRQVAGLPAQVDLARFSPDGTQLALGDANGTVRLWDVGNHAMLALFHHDAVAYVSFLNFSPDGKTLFSAAGDHTLRFWPTHFPQPPIQDIDALSNRLQQLTTAVLTPQHDQISTP